MISLITYRQANSHKPTQRNLKTEGNQTLKTYGLSKQPSPLRPCRPRRHDTSLSHRQLAKYTPSNILHDKETLYFEVQQLKKALNAVIDQNSKLKTRLAVSLTERDRLNRSHERVSGSQEDRYRLAESKRDNNFGTELTSMISQERELLRKQNQMLSRQLKNIKTSAKYWQLAEKQFENKLFLQENLKLSEKNEQLKKRLQRYQELLAEKYALCSKLAELEEKHSKQVSQIEDMHIEIMTLESQLRKQRQAQTPEEKEFQKIMLKTKRQHREFLVEQRRTRSGHKVEAKHMVNSLKSHHFHVQPLKSLRKEQFSSKLMPRQQSTHEITPDLIQDVTPLFDEHVEILKKMEDTEVRLRHLENKIRVKQTPRVQDVGVQTNIAGQDGSFENKGSGQLLLNPQVSVFEQQGQGVEFNGSDVGEILHPNEHQLQGPQVQGKEQEHKPSETDLIFDRIEGSDFQTKHYKSQHNYNSIDPQSHYHESKMTLPTQLKNDPIYSADEQLLSEIRQLLTWRFKYQKYTYADLQKDIQSSEAQNFTYVDLCYMFVNQPFFLSVQQSREVICFVFGMQKPSKGDAVSRGQLLRNLRRVIDDFQAISHDAEVELIQKCARVFSLEQIKLRQRLQAAKDEQGTISIALFTSILEQFQFTNSEVQFIIAETSVFSQSLSRLNYFILFERFLSSQHSQISKRQHLVMIQNEEKQNLGVSNQSKAQQDGIELKGGNKQQLILRQDLLDGKKQELIKYNSFVTQHTEIKVQ